MKIDAVGVASSNLNKTVEFYKILGFEFPEFNEDTGHLEAISQPGTIRLMIDSVSMIKDIMGEDPKPGNTSNFAVLYDAPTEIDDIAEKLTKAGFRIVKEPWDAFWGQRYAVIEDPDGYKVDLFCNL